MSSAPDSLPTASRHWRRSPRRAGRSSWAPAGGSSTSSSLNDAPAFISALADIAQLHMQGWPVARADRTRREAEAQKSRDLARRLGAER
jgi:hypothetical protein